MNGLVVELSTCEIRKDAALIAYHPPHEKLVFKMSSRYEHAKNNLFTIYANLNRPILHAT